MAQGRTRSSDDVSIDDALKQSLNINTAPTNGNGTPAATIKPKTNGVDIDDALKQSLQVKKKDIGGSGSNVVPPSTLPNDNVGETPQVQQEQTSQQTQPDFNFINRKGESVLHIGNDPLGNAIDNLQSQRQNILNRNIGSDATAVKTNHPIVNINGKDVAVTNGSDEINNLDADIEDIKQNAFSDNAIADKYLKQKLNGKQVALKKNNNDNLGLGHETAIVTPNSDLSVFDTKSLQENLDKGNITDQLAFNKVKQQQDLNDVLKSSENLNEAALKYSAKQNPVIQKQIDALQNSGDKLPNAYEGQLVANFLNNPDVIQRAQSDPKLMQQYKQTASSLYTQYPDYAKRVVAQKISQAREDAGLNNPIINVPTQSSTDKIVDDMYKAGQLNDAEKSIYENSIRPTIGVFQSVGRGIGRLIPSIQANVEESPIITPGFFENTENSYVNTLHGMAHSLEDISKVTPIGHVLPLPTDADRLKQSLQNDYSTIALNPKGAWNELGQGTGNMTGFVLPMIMGGTATGAIGASGNASELITNGLVFEGQNRDNALKSFPDNPAKQFMYTTLATAGDMMIGKILPTGEAKEGVNNLLKNDIKDVVNNFVDGNITETAARNTILEKATDYLGKVVKGNLNTGTAMAGFGLLHNGLDAAFGTRNVSLGDAANEAIQNFKSGFLGGTVVSAMAAFGGDQKLNGDVLLEMAANPEYYTKVINDQAKLNPELNATKVERIRNLNEAALINKDLQTVDLDNNKKGQYLIQALNQNIWERKADATTNEVLKSDYIKKANESKKIQQDILAGKEIISSQSKTSQNEGSQKNNGVKEGGETASKENIGEGNNAKEGQKNDVTQKGVAKETAPLISAYREKNKVTEADISDEDLLKSIAQQAQNLATNPETGKVEEQSIKNPKAYENTVAQAGKELVDAAIEKYPAPKETIPLQVEGKDVAIKKTNEALNKVFDTNDEAFDKISNINTLDRDDINNVEIPKDITEQSYWPEKLIEKVFSDLGIHRSKNTAETGTVYYGLELSNGESFKLRVADHGKGKNARYQERQTDGNIEFNENTTPEEILEQLKEKLPDNILRNPNTISENYHTQKLYKNPSNPELIKAVEDVIGKPETKPKDISIEEKPKISETAKSKLKKIKEKKAAEAPPEKTEAQKAETLNDRLDRIRKDLVNKPDELPTEEELRQGEIPVSSIDAERRFSAGERLFGFHEMDTETPAVEITSVKELEKFAPDQLIALPEKEETPIENKNKPNEQEPRDTETIVNSAKTYISEAESATKEKEINAAADTLESAINEIESKVGKLKASYSTEGVVADYPINIVRKEIKKEIVKYAKGIAGQNGWDIAAKDIHPNIPPAGGEVSMRFKIPGSPYEMYVQAKYVPEYTDHYDNYNFSGFFYRLEDPTAKGRDQYKGGNQWQRENISASEMAQILKKEASKYIGKEAPKTIAEKADEIPVPIVKKEQPKAEIKPKRFTQKISEKAKSELDDLWDEFKGLTSKQGITPNPEDEVKKHILGLKIIAKATEAGIYKLADIVAMGFDKLGDAFDNIVPYVKKAYLAFQSEASDDVIDKMDKLSDVRKFDYDKFKNENYGTDTGLEPTAKGLAEGSTQGTAPTDAEQRNIGTVGGKESEKVSGYAGEHGKERPPSEPGAGVSEGRSPIPISGNKEVDAELGGKSVKQENPKPAEQEPIVTPLQHKGNFVIPPDFTNTKSFNVGQKLQDNIDALKTLIVLKNEQRRATYEEQQKLFKYVGWGGIKEIGFDPESEGGWSASNEKLKPQIRQVHELLKELDEDNYKENLESIKGSTLNAHYTAIPIIRGIYNVIRATGFRGGRIIEPSSGIGHFIGAMPIDIHEKSQISALEKDNITGQILKNLYPNVLSKAGVGYEEISVGGANSVDLTISNIPFGNYAVYDPNFTRSKDRTLKNSQKKIHSYFFARAIEDAKPNGLIAFITSTGILDSKDNADLRKMMAERTDLLGALRLPNDTFKGNANTQVTTDIIFLRKLGETENPEQQHDFQKLSKEIVKHKDRDEKFEVMYNKYFKDNPDMVLGKMEAGSMYGKSRDNLTDAMTVTPTGIDLEKRISELADKIVTKKLPDQATTDEEKVKEQTQTFVKSNGEKPGNIVKLPNGEYGILTEADAINPELDKKAQELGINPNDIRDENLYLEDYEKLRANGLSPQDFKIKQTVPVRIPKKYEDAIKDLIPLRTALNDVYAAEYGDLGDKLIEDKRAELNKTYQKFVKNNGTLFENKPLLDKDVDGHNLLALENVSDKKVTGLADIFRKRVFQPQKRAESASSLADAISLNLSETGNLNIDRLSELLGKKPETVIKEGEGIIFKNPLGDFETKDKYLSGNVREKLEQAKIAAESDPIYKPNVKALEEVQPKDLDASQIYAPISAPWIDTKHLEDFASHLFKQNIGINKLSTGRVNVDGRISNTEVTDVYGTKRKTGFELLEEALQNRMPIVTDSLSIGDGKTKQVVNAEETQKAGEKVEKIKQAFDNWVWMDDARRNQLVKKYNENFNNTILPKYDGSHLVFEGYAGKHTPMQHQKDGVWMIAQNMGGILDHIVGSGKSLLMALAANKMKKMGLIKKPIIIGLKANTMDLAGAYKNAFPLSKVLYPSAKDFTPDNRKSFFAKMANNDWDAIVMTHDQFGMIEQSKEVQQEVIGKQVEALENDIRAAKDNNMSKRDLNGLETRKQNLLAKLQTLATMKKDPALKSFDEMGIDFMFVDESQQFKNLAYSTIQRGVSGLGDPTGSSKAFNMLFAIRTLQKLWGGDKGTVFASGTPISNTMVEMYSLFNYLRPNKMQEMGLNSFDQWANTFARVGSEIEFGVTNSLKPKTRMREFMNVPEMAAMYREIADVRNDSNLNLDKPDFKQTYRLKTDKEIANGQIVTIDGKEFKSIGKIKGLEPNEYYVSLMSVGKDVPITKSGQIDYEGGKVNYSEVTNSDGLLVNIAPTPAQRKFAKQIQKFAETKEGIHVGMPDMDEKKKKAYMLIATNLASKMAIDMRLINPSYAGTEVGKLGVAADTIVDHYKESNDKKGIQLVFSDLGTPKGENTAENLFNLLESRGVDNDTLENIFGEKAVADRKSFPKLPVLKERIMQHLEYGEQEYDDAVLEANEDNFNVYQDMKNKLVKRGIPTNEIAFIHDYKTDAQRQKLFEDAREGRIRVILGSTAKLGTGVNVQDRMVGIHHLDVPWRPSDMEQRNGRGIRQGNKMIKDFYDNQMPIYYYATEATLDAYKYQLLDTKQKFIDQGKTGEGGSREISEGEGDEENGVSYAAMTAMLSGNPVILEKAKVDKQVKDLSSSAKAFKQEKYSLKDKIATSEKKQKIYEDQSVQLAKDKALFDKNSTRNEKTGELLYNATIDGKDYTERKATGEKLLEIRKQFEDDYNSKHPQAKKTEYQYRSSLPDMEQKVGKINGFDIVVRMSAEKGDNNKVALYPEFSVKSPVSDISYKWSSSQDAVSLAGHLQREIRDLQSDIDISDKNLAAYKKDIADKKRYLESLPAEFQKQKEYDAALARQAKVEATLNEMVKTALPSGADLENDGKRISSESRLQEMAAKDNFENVFALTEDGEVSKIQSKHEYNDAKEDEGVRFYQWVKPEEPATPPEEAFTETKKSFADRGREIADRIEQDGLKSVLPDAFKGFAGGNLPEGTQTSGFAGNKLFDKAVATAIRLAMDALEAGQDFAQAVAKGFEHLKGFYYENVKNYDIDKVRKDFETHVAKILKPKEIDEDLKDVVHELMNDGHDLKSIQKIAAAELGDSPELKMEIGKAFNYLYKVQTKAEKEASQKTESSNEEEQQPAKTGGTHINKADITNAKDLIKRYPIEGGKISWDESVNDGILKLAKEAEPGEKLIDVAERKIGNWNEKINKELSQRGKSTFNPSDEDLAIMSYYRTNVNEELNRLKPDLSSDIESERLNALNDAKSLQEKLVTVDKVLAESGRVAGRSFYIRQAVAKMDATNNLLVHRMDVMRSQGGEPLSSEQEKAVANVVAEENNLQKDYNNNVLKYSQEDFDAKVREEVDRIMKEKSEEGKLNIRKERTLKQAGDEWANKIRKLKIDTDPNILQSNILGLLPATYNVLIEGIALAVKGGASIGDAIHEVLKNSKYENVNEDDARNHIFNKIDKQDILDKIKESSKEEGIDNITKSSIGKNLLHDLVNNYLREGLRGKNVFDQMKSDLQELFPNIADQQIRDAYLKKGEYELDTKKEIDKEIIDAKSELKNIAKLETKLEEARKGIVAARNDSERRKWTDYEEKLKKEIASELNKKGIALERSPKQEVEIKQGVAEAHNERMDNIISSVKDLLKGDLSYEEKQSLKDLRTQLELSKVDPKTTEKIDKALIRASNNLRDEAIKNVGNKEIFNKINEALSDLDNDLRNSRQDILLSRYKKQLQSRISQAERKLEPDVHEYSDEKPTIRNKVDAETVRYEIEQRQIDSKYRRLQRLAEDKQKKWWEKAISLGQSFLVNELIGGLKTAGVVLSSGITKQPLNTLTNLTFGTIAHLINPELSKAAGAEAMISLRQEKNRYMAHYAAIGEKGMQKIFERSQLRLDESNAHYNDIKRKLDAAKKGTPEYDKLKKWLDIAQNKQTTALLDHQSNFIYKWIGSSAWKDAGQVFLKGASKLDQTFGYREAVGWKDMTNVEKTSFIMGMMGALHGTFKNFSARAEFAAGFVARLENKAKNGIDISTPDEILLTANDSFVNYLMGKYQEDNWVTDAMNAVGKAIEQIGTKPSRYGADRMPKNENISKVAAALYHGKYPIIKTGVNIGREALQEYLAGAFWGGALHGKAIVKGILHGLKEEEPIRESITKEIRKMSPDKVDLIFRCYRKGGLGLVLAGLAAMGYIKFGGFYNQDDWRRKHGELHQGDIEFFGHKLEHRDIAAKMIEHAGVFMSSLMIANTRSVYERKFHGGKDKGDKSAAITDALVSDLQGAMNVVPAFNTGLGNPLTNFSVPYGRTAGDISEAFDRDKNGNVIPRDMSTWKNRFLVNTGFRKFVPIKKSKY